MECHVCLEPFDAAERRPKVLPCGHTFCFRCLQGLQAKRCPLDQKVFETAPGELADNYMVLQLSTKPAERPSFQLWCKTCKKEALAVCADEHVVCSFKKARAEEAAPLLEKLQRDQAGLKLLRQTLNTAAQSLDLASSRSELDRADSRLALVKEGLERAKGEDAAKWTDAKEDAVPCDLSRAAAQLVADLANPSFKVTVQLGEAGGVAWSGEVRPAESAAARLLLCQLACVGGLQQQGQPRVAEQQQQEQLRAGVEEPCLSTSSKILDVSSESSERDIKAMTNVTARSDLAEVRCLLGLHCRASPPWSHKLLERVAPNLEGLELMSPEQRHLDVVLAMPRLQMLSITGVTGQQLRQVAQMASLRRLLVQSISSQLPVQDLPGTALQWLCCGVYPLAAALALVRASADTLEELQLVAASKKHYGCPDLAAELRRCGLKKLKKLVLLRHTYHYPEDHDLSSCRAQKVKLWNIFLDYGMDVAITCSDCDKDEPSVCGNARRIFLGETRFA